nr:hypothetical protein [Tanacetum cinerariifolium]
ALQAHDLGHVYRVGERDARAVVHGEVAHVARQERARYLGRRARIHVVGIGAERGRINVEQKAARRGVGDAGRVGFDERSPRLQGEAAHALNIVGRARAQRAAILDRHGAVHGQVVAERGHAGAGYGYVVVAAAHYLRGAHDEVAQPEHADGEGAGARRPIVGEIAHVVRVA